MFRLARRFVLFFPPYSSDRKNGGEHVVPLFLGIIYIACTILRFPVGGGRITAPFRDMFIKCKGLEIILPLQTTTAYSVK
jgi:hypothetical protein